MAFKTYFKGKTGCLFWFNVLLALVVIAGIPAVTFLGLGIYTHHGEKIDVPNVMGMNSYDAEKTLSDAGLNPIISDSTYKKNLPPGTILDQNPKAGNLVKGDRIIYLTINLTGEPLVELPDLVNNSSVRTAVAQLEALGFKLTAHKYVEGFPNDYVVAIQQGNKELHAREKVSRDRAITLVVGAGDESDTLMMEEEVEDVNIEITDEEGESTGNHFDVDL